MSRSRTGGGILRKCDVDGCPKKCPAFGTWNVPKEQKERDRVEVEKWGKLPDGDATQDFCPAHVREILKAFNVNDFLS